MHRRSIARRFVTFSGRILIAHIVASYVAHLCFGAYAWHRGWLHTENWIRSFPGTPLHMLQGWIIPLIVWFGKHFTEPSTFRPLDVISVASYFGALFAMISLWYWHDRTKRRVRSGFAVQPLNTPCELPGAVPLDRTVGA